MGLNYIGVDNTYWLIVF